MTLGIRNFGPVEQLWWTVQDGPSWTKIAHSRSLWSRGFKSLRIQTKSYLRVLRDTLHFTSRVYFSWHVPLLVGPAVVLIANQVGFYYGCLFYQPRINGPTSPNRSEVFKCLLVLVWSGPGLNRLVPDNLVLIRGSLLPASNLIETVKSTKNEWIRYHPFWMRFAWLFISKVAGSVI